MSRPKTTGKSSKNAHGQGKGRLKLPTGWWGWGGGGWGGGETVTEFLHSPQFLSGRDIQDGG